jgi:serine/threonine protein phosphatase PrpC
MGHHADERGRHAPTPAALRSLGSVPDGFRILPDPLYGQPLMRLPALPVEVRLLLDRSRESALAGEPTQDYLVVRADPRRLSFAVTDGVGSSFLGDVAAQILAARLADWLASVASSLAGTTFDLALTTFLRGLSRQVQEQVATWALPASLSGLVRAALDQQRAYGSEAMFACGFVDLTGGRDATVTVSWLGDARVRVILRDGRQFDHSGQTADRWSSRLGPRGTPSSRSWPLAQVARVIACTDGLLPELDATVRLPDVELSSRLHTQARRPGNDDMALIDIGLTPRDMPAAEAGDSPSTLWRRLTEEPQGRHARTTPAGVALRRLMRAVGPGASGPSPAPGPSSPPTPGPSSAPRHSAGAEPTPAGVAARARPPAAVDLSTKDQGDRAGLAAPPSGVRWRRNERGWELAWSPVPGADSYALQVCREPSFAEPLLYAVRGIGFVVPPIPGPVFVRLRSVVGGEPGPWGGTLDVSTPGAGDARQAPAGSL